MADTCPTCGLPKNLCVCQTIEYEQRRVKIKLETKKWNKTLTLIEGLDSGSIDIDEVASILKAKCACGGAVKNGVIMLQGDQRDKVQRILVDLGLSPENLEII
ncbi:MAG: stress response translation initiation inhibitor YciH [Nitrososphaerota archaeon]|nr:stress response translation initiation inhibitor YciH [Candidatus Calditenuaceae archaeon]MDW8073805.1 stress response translation initiation inhibitor YciH [Nitrososphaerota archaeon]